MPAVLNDAHRQLIYKKKAQKSLEMDPVTVELGDEKFKLEHIDRTKDLPDTRDGVRTALSLFREPKDWWNIKYLLEGLTIAKRRIREPLWKTIINKAGKAGQMEVILECARRSAETSLVLDKPGSVDKIMFWIHYEALFNNFRAEASRKALRMAEQIAFLLEEEKHCGGPAKVGEDPRVSPVVVGVLLQLAGVNSLKMPEDADARKKVESYALRFAGVLERQVDENSTKAGEQIITEPKNPDAHSRNRDLRRLAPLFYAVHNAEQVLGQEADVVQKLRPWQQTWEDRLKMTRGAIVAEEGEEGAKQLLGVQIYDRLLLAAAPA